MGRDVPRKLELVGMSEYWDTSWHDIDEERRYQDWLRRRPICDWCNEPIEDDMAYQIGDALICDCCIDEYLLENHRVNVNNMPEREI